MYYVTLCFWLKMYYVTFETTKTNFCFVWLSPIYTHIYITITKKNFYVSWNYLRNPIIFYMYSKLLLEMLWSQIATLIYLRLQWWLGLDDFLPFVELFVLKTLSRKEIFNWKLIWIKMLELNRKRSRFNLMYRFICPTKQTHWTDELLNKKAPDPLTNQIVIGCQWLETLAI